MTVLLASCGGAGAPTGGDGCPTSPLDNLPEHLSPAVAATLR
ncbi:MAG TPA: hypothetical protein VFY91_14330 [Microbacterium sp.]|nr:hypothetical protein [Microbacterium sp.]